MRLQFLLGKRMEEMRISFPELGRLTGLSPERLRAIAINQARRFSLDELAFILGALELSPNDLLDCYEADVFYGARIEGEITLHVVIKSDVIDPHLDAHDGPQDRIYLSGWDWRAGLALYGHATALDIRVDFEPHPVNLSRQPHARSLREMFPSGSHISIGSQLSFAFTERIVCLMYEVTPFDENKIRRFPLHFVWDRARNLKSSFGRAAVGNEEPGIYATRDNQLIARRVDTKSGEGQDVGLVVTYRITDPAAVRKNGMRSERCICVVAGNSGVGSLGCAKALIDPALAAEFYPSRDNTPRMRVVRTTYERPLGSTGGGGGDNREIRTVSLEPESQPFRRSA